MSAAYFEGQRREMIAAIRLIAQHLVAEIGKTALDDRVLSAMAKVPRHEFVPIEVQPTDSKLTKIVLVAGRPSHGRGEHEFFAGCALLMKLLKETPGRRRSRSQFSTWLWRSTGVKGWKPRRRAAASSSRGLRLIENDHRRPRAPEPTKGGVCSEWR